MLNAIGLDDLNDMWVREELLHFEGSYIATQKLQILNKYLHISNLYSMKVIKLPIF